MLRALAREVPQRLKALESDFEFSAKALLHPNKNFQAAHRRWRDALGTAGRTPALQTPPFSCNISREPMPTFYDRFVECVEHWPKNIALEIQRRDRVESCTYADLRHMAESIGSWLARNGFQSGARVVILADNHPRWVAVFLGVVASGCTAVPLDTALHADQITILLKDSGSSLLFCDVKHLATAQIGRAHV